MSSPREGRGRGFAGLDETFWPLQLQSHLQHIVEFRVEMLPCLFPSSFLEEPKYSVIGVPGILELVIIVVPASEEASEYRVLGACSH